MRRAAVLLTAIALGGCGGAGEAGRPARAGGAPGKGGYGPERPGSGERARPVAPPHKAPSAAVASALAGGAVGVVGVEGAVGVRPDTLDVAADATLEGLRWQRWDSRRARGTGVLSVRDCDPTCASGGRVEQKAAVRLSAPRLCGRATYFDRARVEVRDARPEAPVAYVRAPC